MESLGKYLKTERELRNLSLEEVAKSTKIREGSLKAIEEDRYELLPHAVYVRGFLTIYARYLGLNPNDVILRYQKYVEYLALTKPPEIKQPVPPSKKRISPWLFIVPIFAIMIFISLFIYHIPYGPQEESPPTLQKEESAPIPSLSMPPHLAPQENAGTQATHQIGKMETSRPKEVGIERTSVPKYPSFEVLEASMGTGIGREGGRLILKGRCSEFTCNNQRAYFFTRIKTQREGKIVHVWIWNGKEFHRIEIKVRPPVWSVYSYFTLRPHRAGNWSAEVRDGNKVLAGLSFKVYESATHYTREKR